MRSTPPVSLLRFFRWFCKPELHRFIEGDLLELYAERVHSTGKRSANIHFAMDVIVLFRPSIIRPFSQKLQPTSTAMFRNYFKITFRNLRKRKIYSGINILGLAIGMSSCLLIFQFVFFEKSFDTFHENAGEIYRVNQTTVRPGEEDEPEGISGWALGPTMAEEVPEVRGFVRLHPEYDHAIIANPEDPEKSFEEEQVFYADSSFFDIFSFPMLSGNPEKALTSGGIALSRSMARKYFGDEEAMGKSLEVRGWITGTFRVSGIFEDPPANSHLNFQILLPMVDLIEKSDFRNPDTGWGWTNFITYVLLHKDVDLKAVEKKFTGIFLEHRAKDFNPSSRTAYLTLQPLLDIHLNDDILAPMTVMGSYSSVYFFTAVGIVTLLIAFINYVNLTTARALDRAREVGIRKVIGARRQQLIAQFLSESAIVILLAFLAAFLLAYNFSTLISTWSGIPIDSLQWNNPDFWMTFIALLFILTLFSGLYPAILLSSFRPKTVLKGHSSNSGASVWLRKGLVVTQFAISIALLAGTFIVQNQLQYLKNMDLGMALDQIITITGPLVLPEEDSLRNVNETFANELQRMAAISKTSTSHSVPGKDYTFNTSSIRRVESDESAEIPGSVTFVDSAFTQLYGFKIIAGNGFTHSPRKQSDDDPVDVLANETAIYSLGFESPEEAVGHEIFMGGRTCRIDGVLKDFHWTSAHQEQISTFLWLGHDLHLISAKVNTKNLPQTISDMEAKFKELFPGNPFVYSFADQTFEAQYRNDQRFAKLFNLFAGLAILIACMGLFGLATYTAQQRRKEVGIRKVMGATLSNIVVLLSTDFIKLVLIGFLLAIPIAWFTMQDWLADFAFHIDIDSSVFLLAGVAAMVIAILTVGWQSVQSALTNPVDSIRDE